ncbi:hypothetical protein [Paracoccus sp. (in: a-proteobacteria)]|uniref:hypothetical protein n=1 Tax=Paracoccus sp. TaxID=267 RepID=UPI003A88A97D
MILPVVFFGFGYLILSVQLWVGLPSFYRSFGKLPRDELGQVLPVASVMAVPLTAFAVTKVEALLVTFGLLALLSGLRVRSVVAETASTPDILSAWHFLSGYPMALFDAWTFGGAALLAGIVAI